MDDDVDDIYAGLPDFELDKECERLQHEVEDLKIKTDQFSAKIDELTNEKNKLIKQKSILLKNISILLKTAKQEIKRKDEIISQLRNELQTYSKSKSMEESRLQTYSKSKSMEESKQPEINISQPQSSGKSSSINDKLLKLASNNIEKAELAKKSTLSDLDKPPHSSSTIRDRPGPKIELEKKTQDSNSRRSEVRHRRDNNERYRGRDYRRNIEEDDRSHHRKLTKSQHHYSRSPPRKPRSRSPYSKRKRTRSRSRSAGRKEICSVSPPFTLQKDDKQLRPFKTDNSDASISAENGMELHDKHTTPVDDCKKVNEILRTISPTFSNNDLKTIAETAEKEDGEMSDSDPLEDGKVEQIREECKITPKFPEKAPKTLFTIRMEQKLKKEDEERRRKQAAGNTSDKIDITLFDKPIKVIREPSHDLFSTNPRKPKPVSDYTQPSVHLEVKNRIDCRNLNEEKVSAHETSKESNIEAHCPKLQSSQLQHQINDSNKAEHPANESNTTVIKKVNKPKLTLNICNNLPDKVLKSQIISAVAGNSLKDKQSSVETFSPFKENYKLIEFSPVPLAQPKPLAYVCHKSVDQQNPGCIALSSEPKLSNAKPTSSDTETHDQVPPTKLSSFDIKKPLKPLLPHDILDVSLNVENDIPMKINDVPMEINKPENLDRCLPKTSESLFNKTSEQKSTAEIKENGPVDMPRIIEDNSLKSYRIPKKSYSGSQVAEMKSSDKKRKCPSPTYESKKSRLTIPRSGIDSKDLKNENDHRKKVETVITTKEYGVAASRKREAIKKVSKSENDSKSAGKKEELRERKHEQSANVQDGIKGSKSINSVHKKGEITEKISASKRSEKPVLTKDTDQIQRVKDKPTEAAEISKSVNPILKQDKKVEKFSENKNQTKSARDDPKQKLKVKNPQVESGSKEKAPEKNEKCRNVSTQESKTKVEATKGNLVDELFETLRQNNTLVNVGASKIEKHKPEAFVDRFTNKASSPQKTAFVVTPCKNVADVSSNAFRLDEPPPTPGVPEIENSFQVQSTKESFDDKEVSKKKDLMCGLHLDVTPHFAESSLCLEKNKSPLCPITPDLPSELKTSDTLSKISQEERHNRTSGDNKGGENCDIANFEIFKSVNMNSSSPSIDRSKESSCSNRLQNDLSLSDTDSESKSETSESGGSDSEASDLMDMF